MKACIECGQKTSNVTGMCSPCIGIANRVYKGGAKARIEHLIRKAGGLW